MQYLQHRGVCYSLVSGSTRYKPEYFSFRIAVIGRTPTMY